MEDAGKDETRRSLLAKSGLHCHPLAPFGATTRQHRLAGLGLHTGAEPVSLTPPPAVWLKCALGHRANALLLEKIVLGQTLSISEHDACGNLRVPRASYVNGALRRIPSLYLIQALKAGFP